MIGGLVFRVPYLVFQLLFLEDEFFIDGVGDVLFGETLKVKESEMGVDEITLLFLEFLDDLAMDGEDIDVVHDIMRVFAGSRLIFKLFSAKKKKYLFFFFLGRIK
jgi:hypothetical protein